jgi:hypothetical protein
MNVGGAVRLTASGQVKVSGGAILGFYVANTNGGTLVLNDDAASGGAQLTGTITPAIGWHPLPLKFASGLRATIGGTALDVTFISAR